MLKTSRPLRKILIWFSVIFLSIMLLATFFSKTIYYYMTTKVVVESVINGKFTTYYSFVIERNQIDSVWLYRAEVSSEEYIIYQLNDRCTVETGNDTIKFQIVSKDKLDERYYINLSLIDRLDKDIEIYFRDPSWPVIGNVAIQSIYYDMIIPNNALVQGGYVFVLKNRLTFFGEEQYVEKVKVTVLDSNNSKLAISSIQLTNNSKVVVGWDNELEDDSSVIVLEY